MDNFLEKWKKDSKYRTKIKLLLYTLFVVVVSIYAISLNNINNENQIDNELTSNKENNPENETNKNIINIPQEYDYEINININDELYKYSGTKKLKSKTITKEQNDTITNYLYQDNKYYIEDSDTYILTTEEEVYDIINYNYLDLSNINTYLEKATKESDQYLVYLKDIILGNNSEDYFVIILNNNKINIDYTPLMKQFNSDIEKYHVNIIIEEKE